MVRNLKLTIEYDGTAYHGFQTQSDPKLPTIQSTLEKALERICKQPIRIVGAGRTDAGVHAYGQVVSFKVDSSIPTEKFVPALNSNLPADIQVKESVQVDSDFHARFSATGKTYRYVFDVSDVPSVFMRKYAYAVSRTFDVGKIQEVVDCFVGSHDFAAFASSGRSVKTTVRTIECANIIEDGSLISFTVSGNGFLYNMVRIMAGTLLEVAKGKLTRQDIERALREGRRELSGPTVPPHGLYLVEVRY